MTNNHHNSHNNAYGDYNKDRRRPSNVTASSSRDEEESVKSNWMVIDSNYIHHVAQNGRNSGVNFLADHLKATASSSFDYGDSNHHQRSNNNSDRRKNDNNNTRNRSSHNSSSNNSSNNHRSSNTHQNKNEERNQQQQQKQKQQRTSTTSRASSKTSRNSSGVDNSSRRSLEDSYSRAMSRMNRGGDFDPNFNSSSYNNSKKNRGSSGTNGSSIQSRSTRDSTKDSNDKNMIFRTSNKGGSNSNSNRARTSSTGSGGGSSGSSNHHRTNIARTQSTGSGGSGGAGGSNHTRTSRRGSCSSLGESRKSHIFSVNSRLSTEQQQPKKEKKGVSNKDPADETIAIFGAYGVTGHHFLKFAMEAGYKVKALILPGMEMDDVACSGNLRLVTGSFDEDEKVKQVIHNATYVVCLLNDCDRSLHQKPSSSSFDDQENFPPPIGNVGSFEDSNADNNDDSCDPYSLNLNFMHNLVPLLEESKTCRVLLYQASSLASDGKGTTPILSKMVKKFAVRKNWKQMKREQDRIVKYVVHQTKNTAFNYIITRPSDTLIRDKPSRKKLVASKSQPGPFPITNIDLAEFTLSILRMKKVYNTCPFVVHNGV